MKRKQRAGASRRAFSVVELIVAIGILTFGIAAVYENYIHLTSRSSEQIQDVQAGFLAHQELEKLRVCSFAQLAAWVPPAGPVPVKEDIAFYSAYEINKQPDRIDITVRVWRAQENNSTPPPLSATSKGVVLP